MSETAYALYVKRLEDLKFKDFLKYIQEDLGGSNSVTIEEIKYVFETLKEKRIFVSSDLNERYIVYCLVRYIKSIGFTFSEVSIGGWETGVALLNKE